MNVVASFVPANTKYVLLINPNLTITGNLVNFAGGAWHCPVVDGVKCPSKVTNFVTFIGSDYLPFGVLVAELWFPSVL